MGKTDKKNAKSSILCSVLHTFFIYLYHLLKQAKTHPVNSFLLARVGCGMAGFEDDDTAPLFEDVLDVPKFTVQQERMALFPPLFF